MTDEELAEQVASLLADRTVATAESCTAGRVAESLACVESAADFLRGGLVAYQEHVKRSLLDVAAASVLSEQAASEMATGVRRLLESDVSVATTGLAGGDDIDGVSAGTVFIATCVDGRTRAATHHFDGTPEEVCDRARSQALIDLVAALSA